MPAVFCRASSHSSSYSACWCSCTSLATTSPRAGARACRGVLDRLRPGDRHLARPCRHGLEARPGCRWAATSSCTARSGRRTSRRRSAPRWMPGARSTRSRSARARSSSPPGRSRISCWRWCCSPLLFATTGRPVITAGGRRCAARQRRRARRAAGGRPDRLDRGRRRSTSFEDIQRIITAHPAETLPITIQRGGETWTCRC